MNPVGVRVPPTLRLAVLCESVGEDAEGRPYNLFVPVHTIRFPPAVHRFLRPPALSLYIQLQGGRGTYFIRATSRLAGGTREVDVAAPVEEVFTEDYDVVPLELAIELDRLVFPLPGTYEVLVYANYRSMHEPADDIPIPFPTIRVNVLPADGSAGGAV